MREKFRMFGSQFDTDIEEFSNTADEKQRLNNPILFIFLGDQSSEAMEEIYSLNTAKWRNNSGIFYLQVSEHCSFQAEHVFHFSMPIDRSVREQQRILTHRHFISNEQNLIELNKIIRRIKTDIASSGQNFTSFKKLNVYFVTRIEDPANIILPDVTSLLESIMVENYDNVQMELFALLSDGHELGLPVAHGVSFLREVIQYQSKNFSFSETLKVTEDLIRMKVERQMGPLFDFVFVLSDKLRNGQIPTNSMKMNYELISNINLMKNKKNSNEMSSEDNTYDESRFRQALRSIPREDDSPIFCSAGFAKLKRPNNAIALEVLNQLYAHFKKYLRTESQSDLELLNWESMTSEQLYKSIPDRNIVDEMYSLMRNNNVSYNQLRYGSLIDAETILYSNHAKEFFEVNVEKKLDLVEQAISDQFDNQLRNVVIPQKGLLSAYEWTNPKSEFINNMRKEIDQLQSMIEEMKSRLDDTYDKNIANLPFTSLPMMNKRNIRVASYALLKEVYQLRYEIFTYEVKYRIMKLIENKMIHSHDSIKKAFKDFEQIHQDIIAESSLQSNMDDSDYLGRNIPEYYQKVVGEILQALEFERGQDFYLQDEYIGNVYTLLEQSNGKELLLDKMIEFCKKHIFTNYRFHKSFEEELHERANVNITVQSGARALSKTDLYDDLHNRLLRDVEIRLPVSSFKMSNEYVEMYFIGDKKSEFITYASKLDRGNKPYKLGCIDMKRNTCIEKINILAGFKIENMVYFQNNKEIYESYIQQGFLFHKP
jgi:hypothetical protein